MYKIKDRPPPSPTYMSEEQMGQQSPMSHTAVLHTPPKPSRLRECTHPESANLHDASTAQYLNDLRAQKAARPSGSRPPPPSKFTSLRRMETAPIEPQTNDDRPPLPSSNSMPIMPAQRLSHQRAESDVRNRSPFAGRPLARPPSTTPEEPSKDSLEEPQKRPRPTSITYMENGTRWMEKQETKSLRMALEDMDLDEEKKIHSAAQDEAAELVWKHKNPDAPYSNPEAPIPNPDAKRDYRAHLRKGSYQRSHSQEQVPTIESRKSSGGSQRPSLDMPTISKRTSMDATRKISPPSGVMSMRKARTPSGKSYSGLAEAVEKDIAVAFRKTSGSNKRIMSGEKKMYMHRNDRIWEDPQERSTPSKLETVPEPVKPAVTPVQPPAHVRNNPFARRRLRQEAKLEHSTSAPVLPVAKHDSIEIQRNAPTQSRKAWYTANEPLPPTPPSSRDEPADEVQPKSTPTKDGKEIRSDDIRAATSKQRKDRSPNLPQPTLVSDKPGRPIVSFKQDPKPKEVILQEVHTAAMPDSQMSTMVDPAKEGYFGPSPGMPNINISEICVVDTPMPPIPTIVVPDDPAIPSVVLPEEPDFASSAVQSEPVTPAFNVAVPTFSFSGPEDDVPPVVKKPAQRPLPTPTRPLPHHAATNPLPRSKPHYSPSVRQSGALCAHCALPIAGRILSAAGERFHPGCFVCHQCHTNLELVAFYPEPEKQRSERVERIYARQHGRSIDATDGMTEEEVWQQEAEDGDESLRFYCHLDFHELFSPRCKSCKTPIEGEVIVACGAEWHVGHFFCAQCGDPFDSSTPFVEKEGYAWCVGCHTNRYSSKCRKCRKPVTDLVVKALGSDWHDKCFVCMVSLRKDITGRQWFDMLTLESGMQWRVRGRAILSSWGLTRPSVRAVRGEEVKGMTVALKLVYYYSW